MAISVKDNKDYIDVDYTCNNETEIIDKQSEILDSEKITEIITNFTQKVEIFN